MIKEPPTSRQMLCFTGERGDSGEDSPPCFVGSGHTRKAAQEGVLFHFPHIQAESDDGKERKSGWQEEVEKQRKGSARAGSAQAGTSEAWPHPWGLCSRRRQPRLCGVREDLQSCRRVFVGRTGASTGHSASSSPLHPGRTSLLLPAEESQPQRSWAGGERAGSSGVFPQAWHLCVSLLFSLFLCSG